VSASQQKGFSHPTHICPEKTGCPALYRRDWGTSAREAESETELMFPTSFARLPEVAELQDFFTFTKNTENRI